MGRPHKSFGVFGFLFNTFFIVVLCPNFHNIEIWSFWYVIFFDKNQQNFLYFFQNWKTNYYVIMLPFLYVPMWHVLVEQISTTLQELISCLYVPIKHVQIWQKMSKMIRTTLGSWNLPFLLRLLINYIQTYTINSK